MIDSRLAANLAALQHAAKLIEADVPLVTPEETKAMEDAARLAEQERLRRPTPEEAAKAWKARNKEMKRRSSITIERPEQAVEIWLNGVRRNTGSDRPADVGNRSPRVGETAEEQIIAKVRQTYALFDYAEGLEAAIQAWPLPMTFYDPVPPLCGVERELLADPRRYEPPSDTQKVDAAAEREGYLMPGLRREAS